MNTEYFPHFIRANYPVIANESNENLIELGEEFKKYLEGKFQGDFEKLKPIWDIEPMTVIMNHANNHFKFNGYHPALVIHFSDFVEKMKNSQK